MSEQKVIKLELPIDWQFPAGLVSRYATHLIVQHTEHEFVLSFFEVLPPTVFGPPEQVNSKIDALASIPAECVARIVVAADRMPSFVQVLDDNLERYQAKEYQEE